MGCINWTSRITSSASTYLSWNIYNVHTYILSGLGRLCLELKWVYFIGINLNISIIFSIAFSIALHSLFFKNVPITNILVYYRLLFFNEKIRTWMLVKSPTAKATKFVDIRGVLANLTIFLPFSVIFSSTIFILEIAFNSGSISNVMSNLTMD